MSAETFAASWATHRRKTDQERGWTRQVCSRDELGPELADHYGCTTYLGDDSASLPARRLRLVSEDAWDIPPGEIARAWWREATKRAGYRGDRGKLPTPPPPPMAHVPGEVEGEWEYVDIDRCYLQIGLRIGLGCRYDPEFGLATGGVAYSRGAVEVSAADAADLLESRAVRLHLWSVMRGGRMVSYHPGGSRECVPWRLANRDHAWLLMHIVHAIAAEALEGGAVVWMVDGGIFRAPRGREFRASLARRWGLTARIEHAGPGAVWGPGRWAIGKHATATPRRQTGPSRRVLDLAPIAEDLRQIVRQA